MIKVIRKSRAAGFSLVEAAVAGFVVAISVAGLAVSIVYGRNLERYTATTWRATSAATAALEQLRAESNSTWGDMQSDWNDKTCSESGFGDPIGDKMRTTIGTDATKLDSSTGMYATGATTPNFYFVEIRPNASEGLSDSLRFQTYVANRSAIGGSTTTSGGTGGGGGTGGTNTTASKLSTAPGAVAYSGGNKTVKFNLVNNSSSALSVTAVNLTAYSGIKVKVLKIGGKTLYNQAAGSTTVTVTNVQTTLTAGLVAGNTLVQIDALAAINNGTCTLALTFSDNSTATVQVHP